MPDLSAGIRNAIGETIVEMQRLADQLEDMLSQAGLAQRGVGDIKIAGVRILKIFVGTLQTK